MRSQGIFWLSLICLATLTTKAQKPERDSTSRQHFIGSTLFILGNFIPGDPNAPDFIQLNAGCRITSKQAVSIEIKTWKYAWPLGIPYGSSFEAPEEKYPGFIRDFGIALVYQRFWWKGAYTAIHAMNTLQKYTDDQNRKLKPGYQLFMTYRLGYHIPLFNNRLFIEPSVAMTHWPVKTGTPQSFAQKEGKWPRYFFPEPGLHFGMKF